MKKSTRRNRRINTRKKSNAASEEVALQAMVLAESDNVDKKNARDGQDAIQIVTFDAGEEYYGDALEDKSYEYPGVYSGFSVPTAYRYTFIGWFTAEDDTGVEVKNGDAVTTDSTRTLYAHWSAWQTVIFIPAYGDEPDIVAEYPYGSTYTDFPVLTREGFTFTGWYTDIEESGTHVNEGEAVTSDEVRYLYAHFNLGEVPLDGYDVFFDAGEGQFQDGSQVKTYHVELGEPLSIEIPTYEEYEFTCFTCDGYSMTSENAVFEEITQDAYEFFFEHNQWTVVYSDDEDYVVPEDSDDDAGVNIGGGGGGGQGGGGGGGRNHMAKKTSDFTFTWMYYVVSAFTILKRGYNKSKKTIVEDGKSKVVDVLPKFKLSHAPKPKGKNDLPFVGWKPDLPADNSDISQSKTFKAQYKEGEVVLSFVDWDDKVLAKKKLKAGQQTTAPDVVDIPGRRHRPGFVFQGWDRAVYRDGHYWVLADESYARGILYRRDDDTQTEPGEMVVHAMYEEESTQTVTFDAQGGEVSPTTMEFTYPGGKYDGLPTPTRTVSDALRYEFLGWYSNPEGQWAEKVSNGDDVTETATRTLYAYWEEVSLKQTVSFDLLWDSVDAAPAVPSHMEFDIGSEYENLPTLSPTFSGNYGRLQFEGWFDSPNEDGYEVQNGNTVSDESSRILYAHWTLVSQTVHFSAGDKGTVSQTILEVNYPGVYSGFPTPTPNETSAADNNTYRFTGWFDETSGEEVKSGYEVTNEQFRILNARWERVIKKQTVHFYVGVGGTISQDEMEFTYPGVYSGFPVPTPKTDDDRFTYSFLGWFDSQSTSGNHVADGDAVSNDDTRNLYAHWDTTIKKQTVLFYAGEEGTVSETSKDFSYPGTYSGMPTPTPKEDAHYTYEFLGWYDESDGEVLVDSSDSVTNETSRILYAHWKKTLVMQTVTFDASGGTVSETSKDFAYPGTYSGFPIPTPRDDDRYQYEFKGWIDDDGNEVKDGYAVTEEATRRLRAQWESTLIRKQTVTFDVNWRYGGEQPATPSSIDVPFPGNYTWLPAVTATGSGEGYNDHYSYTFIGWFSAAGEDGVPVKVGDDVTDAPSRVLYAHWDKRLVKQTVEFNAGEEGTVSETSKDFSYPGTYSGMPTPTPKEPTDSQDFKYEFKGWWTRPQDKYGGELVSETSDMTNEPIRVLYAHWDKGYKFTITVVASPAGVGGTVSGGGEYYPNDEITITASVSVSNIVFSHWETNGENVSNDAVYTFTALLSATYTAIFKTPDASLVYDVGPYGSDGPATVQYDASIGTEISSVVPKHLTDNKFLGWSETQYSQQVQYVGGGWFHNGQTGTNTIYAVWENPDMVSVIYHPNGTEVSNMPADQTGIPSDSLYDTFLSKTVPYREGYEFLGWSESASATEATYQPNANLGQIKRDYELYAVWQEQDKFTITVVASPSDVGTVTGGGEYYKDTSATITATTTSDSVVFSRWEKDGENVSSNRSYTFQVTEDATYTAIFSVPDASLVYDASPGTGGPETVYYDAEIGTIISSTIPQYSGHIFLGWTDGQTSYGATLFPGDWFRNEQTGEHTVHAVWADKTGTIDDIIQVVVPEPVDPVGDIATVTATWTIDSYVPVDINCVGHIDWSMTGIQSGYHVSKIVFYSGSTRLGDAYNESGTLNGLSWQMRTPKPPSQMRITWAPTGSERHFEVSVRAENPSEEAEGCYARIMPANVISGYYLDNDVISLVATAGTDWKFLNWDHNGNVSSDSTYNIVVSQDNAGSYVAVFHNEKKLYKLTTGVYPPEAGGPGLAQVEGAGEYHIGDEITLRATNEVESEDPDNKVAYGFDHWELQGGYDYPESEKSKSNPYVFKLSQGIADMGMHWIAVYKSTNLYQVLTRSNSARGLCTKSPDKAGYLYQESVTITGTPDTQYSDYTSYACLRLKSSLNNELKNTSLKYGSLVRGITHTFIVQQDIVWTAYFSPIRIARLYTDYYPEGPLPSEPTKRMTVFPGYNYGFSESLPKPVREGYYFHGWFTERGTSGTLVTDATKVPEISEYVNLYAHWNSDDTKFYITGTLVPNRIGSVAVTGNANEGYFKAGETCSIVATKNDTVQAQYWDDPAIQYYTGTFWTETGLNSASNVEFVVGDKPEWEYDDESDDDKHIDIRFWYYDNSVSVQIEVVPADGSMGYALISSENTRATNSLPVEVTAYPKTELGYKVAKWEIRRGSGAWSALDNDNVSGNTASVTGDKTDGVITVRVTFGQEGTLTYNNNGGTPSIPLQTYTTNEEFELSSTVPQKSAFAFVGWGDGSTSKLDYQPGQEVSFAETSKTLEAIWYSTPQQITHIAHYNVTTQSAYTGTPATVTASVDDITRSDNADNQKAGKLHGNIKWTVAMPTSGSESDHVQRFSGIRIGKSEYASDILSSDDQNNTEGKGINFLWTNNIHDDWYFTVCYISGADTYVATFNANGGDGAPADIIFEAGKKFTIPTQVPTRSEYTFIGWSTDSSASPTDSLISPGSEYDGPEKNLTFYAIWAQGIQIKIIWHSVTSNKDSTAAIADAKVWVTETDKTVHWSITNVKQGYELSPSGTIVVRDSKGTRIGDGSGTSGFFQYHNTGETPGGTWTATINYLQQSYTITYDTQGGTPTIPDQVVDVTTASAVKISSIKPKKTEEGASYKFLGWAESAGATSAKYSPGATISIKGDITLYAVYEKTEDQETSDDSDPQPPESNFTVYAESGNSEAGSVTPTEKSYKDGDSISFTANANDGWKFSYWVDTSGGAAVSSSQTYSFTGTAAQNGHTFMAVFTPIDVSIPTGLLYSGTTGYLLRQEKDGKDYLVYNE